jgi:hypothetical protein
MVVGRVASWSRGRKILLALGSVLLLALGFFWMRYGERVWFRWVLESPASGRCDKKLDRAVLDRSLALGTSFLLAHQRPEGNFDYEYDWRRRTQSSEDNEVRQAGAAWGLATLYREQPTPALGAAVERALRYFEEHSRLTKNGQRCVVYPDSETGGIGTVALIGLAHIEYLRGAKELTAERRQELEARLDEYLRMLVRAVHPSGLWYGEFEPKSCKPKGEPSPYADGEALLALVKAAKYLGRREHLPVIMAGAAAGKRLNIVEALQKHPDSDVTKGFYQWSSMAFYELATSDFPETRVYGDTLLELADWMIDVHAVLTRARNTGYAFEGITHAYALAKQRGDARKDKYACVIDVGLDRLMSWQVGGPRANSYAAGEGSSAPLAQGGVQNAAFEPGLRIDVTQHQMHATLLARQLVY